MNPDDIDDMDFPLPPAASEGALSQSMAQLQLQQHQQLQSFQQQQQQQSFQQPPHQLSPSYVQALGSPRSPTSPPVLSADGDAVHGVNPSEFARYVVWFFLVLCGRVCVCVCVHGWVQAGVCGVVGTTTKPLTGLLTRAVAPVGGC